MFHGWQRHQSYNTSALSTLAGRPAESEDSIFFGRKPYFFLGAPPQTPLWGTMSSPTTPCLQWPGARFPWTPDPKSSPKVLRNLQKFSEIFKTSQISNSLQELYRNQYRTLANKKKKKKNGPVSNASLEKNAIFWPVRSIQHSKPSSSYLSNRV